jgi:hypothetical protein
MFNSPPAIFDNTTLFLLKKHNDFNKNYWNFSL